MYMNVISIEDDPLLEAHAVKILTCEPTKADNNGLANKHNIEVFTLVLKIKQSWQVYIFILYLLQYNYSTYSTLKTLLLISSYLCKFVHFE